MARRHDRKSISVRVLVQGEILSGQAWFDTGDISEGGAYLVSDFLFEIGTQIALSLTLADSRQLQIRGEVKWVNLGNDETLSHRPPGMGIEFDNGDTDALNELAQFIARHDEENHG